MLLNANLNKIIPKTTIMQQKNPSLSIIRGMKHASDSTKILVKDTFHSVLQNCGKNQTNYNTETINQIIKNQTLVKKLTNYPPSFVEIFQQNQNLITIDALDTIIRSYTTFKLMNSHPNQIRQLLIAYVYSSGELNKNLKTIATFLAIPAVKEKIKDISDFSNFRPKNSIISDQLDLQLKFLKGSEFPKFDEALTTITINQSLHYPLIFLDPAWLTLMRNSKLLFRDNTRNVDWDAMLIRVEKVTSEAGTFFCVREYLPVDIKNTTLGMGPKDNIYRNSENDLRYHLPQYQKTLLNDINTKIMRAEDTITKMQLLRLQNKIETNQKQYLTSNNLAQAIKEWNDIQHENLSLIGKVKLPFNLLSFTTNEEIKSILPETTWQLYNTTYDTVVKHSIISKLITTTHYKEKTKDSREVDHIFDSLGDEFFVKNRITNLKNSTIINDGQSERVQKIIQTLINKTTNTDDFSV